MCTMGKVNQNQRQRRVEITPHRRVEFTCPTPALVQSAVVLRHLENCSTMLCCCEGLTDRTNQARPIAFRPYCAAPVARVTLVKNSAEAPT